MEQMYGYALVVHETEHSALKIENHPEGIKGIVSF